jgi:hypothetical protein
MNGRYSLFFILLFSLHLSCKKEADSYPQFPIELSLADAVNGIQLNWPKVNTSDFIDYQLVRSTGDSIPEFRFLSLNPRAFVIARFTDIKKTTFFDDQSNVSRTEKTYYRFFVRLEGRVLSSPNMVINSTIVNLGSSFSEILSNNSKDNPRFYLANSGKAECAIYDAKAEKITVKGSLNFNNFTNLRMTLGSRNGANEELAAIALGTQITFNDASNLQALATITIGSSVTPLAIVGTLDGFFIVITNELVNNVKYISIGTHTILSQSTVNFGFAPYAGSVLIKNPIDRECILRDPNGFFDSTRIARFRYNAQGQISDVINGRIVNTSFSIDNLSTTVSTDGAYYVLNNSVINRNLTLEKRVFNSSNSAYLDFCFNPTNGKLYAIELNLQGAANALIDEMDFPSLVKTRKMVSRIQGIRSFVVDNNLLVFSNSFVQKIPL